MRDILTLHNILLATRLSGFKSCKYSYINKKIRVFKMLYFIFKRYTWILYIIYDL